MTIKNTTLLCTITFGTTLFLSALLLFSVQPMFGKLLLPLLGGTPSVWNTCMVFYQSLLFFGYLYAHVSSTRLQYTHQIVLHLGIFALSLALLPVGLSENTAPSADSNPLFWLLGTLAVVIGLPFFVVSTTAPLLQKWFSELGHNSSDDPYFLYAASNAGSLLALLSYPFLIEPVIGLTQQTLFWSVGYAAFGICLGSCAYLYWKFHSSQNQEQLAKTQSEEITETPLQSSTIMHWLALAFVPSSLLLGVTNHISTDIAAAPLLWILPLSLYLLSFVIVFSRQGDRFHPLMVAIQPIILLPLIAFSFINPAAIPYWLNLVINLLAFFAAAMVCHGQLAINRPSTVHLTHYYLIMSFGGMLGGLFNTFVAPVIFNSVVEYPLMIIAALLLRPTLTHAGYQLSWSGKQLPAWVDWVVDTALPLALLITGIVIYLSDISIGHNIDVIGVVLLVLAGLSYALRERPMRYGLFVGALLVLAIGLHNALSNVIYRERTFFGVMSVQNTVLPEQTATKRIPRRFHELWHGTTKHGAQHLDARLKCEPLNYYSRSGPIGQFFKAFDQVDDNWNIAVIGLGAGTMAAYAKPDQHWRFLEIDPEVNRIASDSRFFTYLSDCHSSHIKLEAGDGRLLLKRIPDHSLNLLVLDAFSSDAIPTHLLTREALTLYKLKLKNNGYMAFHITNRHLELRKVIASLAWDMKYSLLAQQYFPAQEKPQITRADWVILASNDSLLQRLKQRTTGDWKTLPLDLHMKPWTDDFSNIFDVWKE
ncbi:MAG TPA: spermidine synthase [Crenotrichaceae bacterium]|nr:spermidine synthase [Crenotrichaceae bacterium]